MDRPVIQRKVRRDARYIGRRVRVLTPHAHAGRTGTIIGFQGGRTGSVGDVVVSLGGSEKAIIAGSLLEFAEAPV